MTPGSFGAGNIFEPSRVFTGDAVACDASPQSELVFRPSGVVTQLPLIPGTPGSLAVLNQAGGRHGALQHWRGGIPHYCWLGLSGIAEYARRVALASRLLNESNGCVVQPTEAELRTHIAMETGAARREAAAAGARSR